MGVLSRLGVVCFVFVWWVFGGALLLLSLLLLLLLLLLLVSVAVVFVGRFLMLLLLLFCLFHRAISHSCTMIDIFIVCVRDCHILPLHPKCLFLLVK